MAGSSTSATRTTTAAARRVVDRRTVVAVRDGVATRHIDSLAGEEPMEIRVNGDAVSVTMRTPGNDFELALGFCLTEGIVQDPSAVRAIRYCVGDDVQEYNVVDVGLIDRTPVADSLRRNVYTTSSCGLCGTASIDAVRKRVPDVSDDALRLSPDTLAAFPDRLRAAQRVFDRTGGLHAAGVFDPAGELLCLREDVGRHNAVDKVIGWAATERRLPLTGHTLMVSGRIAFEIAQKALVAGFPLVAAVSAPSSLAVQLAESAGMTVVGFLRGSSMNVYCGAHRVAGEPAPADRVTHR
ncbi:MAG: formate dehydrogenase accessory sulfurtransferase FdhD [Acidimicrobiales bacterium]